MGTITERSRSDGTKAFRAEIVIRKDGKRQRFAQTFDREATAKRWMKKKEDELRKPGGVERKRSKTKTLSLAIDTYVSTNTQIGRTKAQVLNTIKNYSLADTAAERITSQDIVSFAQTLLDEGRKPQTVNNYLSHLSAIFQVADSAWGIPLEPEEMKKAMATAKRLNIIRKPESRDRRPTMDEMDKLMKHFVDRSRRRNALPMHVITAFALFSTRRQDEICRISQKDYEPQHRRVLVRDMKNPGEKISNHVWCELPKPACKIIAEHGQDPIIFPYTRIAVSAAFTRACKLLEIEDLHFHDLRHEGISRLFEMGLTIPQAASYSGHRSWSSLQRYAHIRSTGDRWKNWSWIESIT